MARKRKRASSTRDTNIPKKKKRAKGSLASGEESPADPEQEYRIRAIVGETKTKYQIDWEPDERTGEFAKTWEPKDFANQLAVDDWEERKRTDRAAKKGVARKKSATPKGRGGPKKRVVESSSPPPQELPETSPATNGNGVQTEHQRQDDDLEIGESQPTAGGAEDSAASSPLFVPADSPRRKEKEQPSVQISDPPSSYAAGGYLDLSSSQVPETVPRPRVQWSVEPESSQAQEEFSIQRGQPQASPVPSSSQVAEVPSRQQEQASPERSSPAPAQPQSQTREEAPRKKSPEPSQWQPEEEGDTSRTTNNTTAISAAPTSSSEPTRSVPVNFGDRANKIVPDSQSLPDSSSFAPSGTDGTTSSSAPEARGRGRPVKEVSAITGLSQAQTQDPQSSWQGFSSQPTGLPQGTAGERATASQEQGASGASQSSQAVSINGDSQDQEHSQLLSAAKHSTQGSASQPQRSTQYSEHAGRASSPLNRKAHESQVAAASQDLGADFTSQPASQPETGISHPLPEQPQISDGQSQSHVHPTGDSSQAGGLEESQSQIPSAHYPRSVFSQQANGSSVRSIPGQESSGQGAERDVRETTERPDTDHVDLTADTQTAAAQTSSIAVTPLPPRHLFAAQRNSNNTLPDQSLKSHSFPFDTQIRRDFTSTAELPARAQSAGFQGQASVQSQRRTDISSTSHARGSTLPPTFSSENPPSSSIPGPPSQSLRTFNFGESAPHRPSTPSSPNRPSSSSSVMDPSSSSTAEGLEKLRAMRARSRAELEARRKARATPKSTPAPSAPEISPPKSAIPPHVTADAPPPNPAKLASPLLQARDGARSPSVVPAMENLPEITTEEMNTSERYPTLLPQASIQEDGEKQRSGSIAGRATPTAPPAQPENVEKASAHVVPISLVGHQRDQYPQMVYYHQELIQRFLETRTPDAKTADNIERFVERMRAITLHPDLDNAETFTQYDVDPSQQAGWDVSCSAKFRFLESLLKGLRDHEMHAVIALQSGRLTEILQTFLRGIGVWKASDKSSNESEQVGSPRLTVSVFTGDKDSTPSTAPDLIICLDNSFHADDSDVRALRQQNGKWCPLASLVVPRSIEHIENHLSATLSHRARIRALVSGINQLKTEAGRLEAGQLSPADSAKELVKHFVGGTEGKEWPLAGLGALKDFDSQTESEIDPPEDAAASPAVGGKRHRTGSDGRATSFEISKRVRTEASEPAPSSALPTTINPVDVELTHISYSLNIPTSTNTTNPVQTSTEKRLQSLLHTALARADDLTTALSDLQYRHEDARTLLLRTTAERDAATTTAQAATTRMTEELNRTSALRTERTTLQTQLETANAALLSHAIPERAEFESLRQALALATTEKDALARKLEQSRSDAEFLRSRYQDASSTAEREVQAAGALRAQVASLERRASGEQVKLKQMGRDGRVKGLEEENRKLRVMLKEREAGMKFRDEEISRLKEAGRGRMGTRGTSVPRSPGPGGQGFGGRGSRQGSPAVGEMGGARGRKGEGLLHPLRNNA